MNSLKLKGRFVSFFRELRRVRHYLTKWTHFQGYDFFISYCHQSNKEEAQKLAWALREDTQEPDDVRVFLDSKDCKHGDELDYQISSTLRASTALILLVSEEALRSEWVLEEVAFMKKMGRRIFPIDMDGSLKNLPDDSVFKHLLGNTLSYEDGPTRLAAGHIVLTARSIRDSLREWRRSSVDLFARSFAATALILLGAGVTSLMASVNHLQELRSTLEQQAKALVQQIEDQLGAKHELEQDVAGLEKIIDQAYKRAARDRLRQNELEENIFDLEHRQEQASIALQEERGKKAELQHQLVTLDRRIEKKEAERERLLSEMSELESANAMLESQKQTKTHQYEHTRAALAIARTALALNENDLADMRREAEVVRANLEHQTQKVARGEATLAILAEMIADAELEQLIAKQDAAHYRAESDTLRGEVTDLNEEVGILESNEFRLESDLEVVSTEYAREKTHQNLQEASKKIAAGQYLEALDALSDVPPEMRENPWRWMTQLANRTMYHQVLPYEITDVTSSYDGHVHLLRSPDSFYIFDLTSESKAPQKLEKVTVDGRRVAAVLGGTELTAATAKTAFLGRGKILFVFFDFMDRFAEIACFDLSENNFIWNFELSGPIAWPAPETSPDGNFWFLPMVGEQTIYDSEGQPIADFVLDRYSRATFTRDNRIMLKISDALHWFDPLQDQFTGTPLNVSESSVPIYATESMVVTLEDGTPVRHRFIRGEWLSEEMEFERQSVFLSVNGEDGAVLYGDYASGMRTISATTGVVHTLGTNPVFEIEKQLVIGDALLTIANHNQKGPGHPETGYLELTSIPFNGQKHKPQTDRHPPRAFKARLIGNRLYLETRRNIESVRDLDTGSLIPTQRIPVASDRTGRMMVEEDPETKELHVTDNLTGKTVNMGMLGSLEGSSVAISSEGQHLVTLDRSQLRIYDIERPETPRTFEIALGSMGLPPSLTVNRDGTVIACSDLETIFIFDQTGALKESRLFRDIHLGARYFTMTHSSIVSLALSPEGDRLLITTGNAAERQNWIWDWEESQARALDIRQGMRKVVFDSSGRYLVGHDDASIYFWETRDESLVASVAFGGITDIHLSGHRLLVEDRDRFYLLEPPGDGEPSSFEDLILKSRGEQMKLFKHRLRGVNTER